MMLGNKEYLVLTRAAHRQLRELLDLREDDFGGLTEKVILLGILKHSGYLVSEHATWRGMERVYSGWLRNGTKVHITLVWGTNPGGTIKRSWSGGQTVFCTSVEKCHD